ncbi:hypothetical protein D3H65_14975 [Paraflavitalea soli]|uniref:non-specific serine/threonine protein kinase n=2 Tax=Paraflavitalea soli TaxID=2315862 RepID=A0A3B7MUB1_9BACT|nr:hypothetical protein D3H65_14975 [Paraflavitalea soli]
MLLLIKNLETMKSEILQPKVEEEVIFSQASEVPPAEEGPEQEAQPKGKVEKKAGKRVGYNYIIVKSYKESQKNDVVKCLYIKSLTNWGFCVIKEGSYGDTKDKEGRDIIDRLKWQKQLHEQLQAKVRIPRLLGHFEERGNYYLVIEHIKGKALQKVCSENRTVIRESVITGNKLGKQLLDYLIQITDILTVLHGQQIVHRDATPNNYMVTPGGKVALIDMEMCYALDTQFPTPPFPLGTHGYMSTQQEAIQTPTKAEDIFALGAIILQMWTGVAPGKLSREPMEVLRKKVAFFIPDKAIAAVVLRCLAPEDVARPAAAEVKEVILQYKKDLKKKVSRPVNQPGLFSKEDILATLQATIHTLASPLLADEEKGWFSDDMTPPTGDDKHKLRKQWYASYNRGVTGVVYLLAQAKKAGLDVDVTLPFVDKALELVRIKYIKRLRKASGGLHYASDGIAAVLTSAVKHGLIETSEEHLEWIDKLLEKKNDTTNMIGGVAGQGLANMVCKAFISPATLRERLERYAQFLSDKQEEDGSWTNGFIKKKYSKNHKKKVSPGFAFGMAGTLYFLLELGKCYPDNTVVQEMTEQGLRWLMKKAARKKDTYQWRSSRDKELNYGWSDGSSGIALTFIKAYEYTGRQEYKEYALGALRSIPVAITDTNISQWQGLSGLGEVYLEAYRVLRDQEWLDRAGWIAQVIMQLKKEHPKHGNYWLVEHERQPVANFMLGNSGVMHFLLRFCHPDEIGFPLSV